MSIVKGMTEITTDTADVLGDRLESLVRQLVLIDFDREDGISGFQNRLLDLLIDVQSAIRLQKSQRRSDARAEALAHLRFLKEQTYELGNAFAWLVLGFDRRVIDQLRRNDKAPPPVRDASLEGVKAITGHLQHEGYGFPLLHDITTCLRIGDVTFVDANTQPVSLWTCEVKTTRLPTLPEDPAGTLNLEIKLYSVTPHPKTIQRDETSASAEGSRSDSEVDSSDKREGRKDRRLDGQILRMTRVQAHLSAPEGEVVEIDGGRHFFYEQGTPVNTHVAAVKALAKSALKDGWAAGELEPGVAFAAVHPDDGAKPGGPWLTEPLDRVKEILFPGGTDAPDGVSLAFFPSRSATGHLDAIPYHLIGLDEEVVAPLALGRLIFVLAVRVSAVYSQLEDAGLSLTHDGTFDLWGDNAYVWRTVPTPKGDAKVEFHFTSMLGVALREFLTLASISSRVAETLDATVAGGVAAHITATEEPPQSE